MLSVTGFETGKLMSGEAEGITRLFHDDCPFERNQEEMLTSRFIKVNGQETVFAKVRIKSIRPSTFDERCRNNRLAKLDGFPNAYAWRDHFELKYGDQRPSQVVHRLQLIVDEMEKG